MLVALYGPSRAGKDTVAGILVNKFEFEQRNFATPIRTALYHIFQHIAPHIAYDIANYGWDYVKERWPATVQAMISLGQDMRNMDEDIWLNGTINKPYTRLVIPDMRQPNEAAEIIKRGGLIWKVDSTRPEVKRHGMDGLLEELEFDAVFQNDGTIEDLEKVVIAAVQAQLDV